MIRILIVVALAILAIWGIWKLIVSLTSEGSTKQRLTKQFGPVDFNNLGEVTTLEHRLVNAIDGMLGDTERLADEANEKLQRYQDDLKTLRGLKSRMGENNKSS